MAARVESVTVTVPPELEMPPPVLFAVLSVRVESVTVTAPVGDAAAEAAGVATGDGEVVEGDVASADNDDSFRLAGRRGWRFRCLARPQSIPCQWVLAMQVPATFRVSPAVDALIAVCRFLPVTEVPGAGGGVADFAGAGVDGEAGLADNPPASSSSSPPDTHLEAVLTGANDSDIFVRIRSLSACRQRPTPGRRTIEGAGAGRGSGCLPVRLVDDGGLITTHLGRDHLQRWNRRSRESSPGDRD